MPFCGLNDADIVFEMLVNARSTRCLALVTDVYAIERIGAIRSLRYNFIDIAQAYDGIVVYASASDQVLADMRAAGVANLNALSSKNKRPADGRPVPEQKQKNRRKMGEPRKRDKK